MKGIATLVESYDVVVGTTVLYPIGFFIDFWKKLPITNLGDNW